MSKFKTRNELRTLVIDTFSKEAEIFPFFSMGKKLTINQTNILTLIWLYAQMT